MNIQYLHIFIAGLFISLTGSLPLGTLNVTAMRIAAHETRRSAMQFAIGVTVIEMACIVLTLLVAGRLAHQAHLFFVFRITSVAVLLAMAVSSFIAVAGSKEKNIILDNKIRRLLLGASLSLVNPLQIPFWMGWVFYLLTQSMITNSLTDYTIFTLSAGIGTFMALLIFILAGRKFAALMRNNKRTVNMAMGCLFTIMTIIQLIQLF